MNQSTEGYGFLHDSQKAHYQPNQFSANSQHSTTAAECSNQDGSQHLPKFLFGSLESPLVHKKSFAGPSRAKVSGTSKLCLLLGAFALLLLYSVGSPSILKTRDSNSTNTPSPGQKSVHWSPLLVKERLKSPESIQRKVITHLPSPWSGKQNCLIFEIINENRSSFTFNYNAR
jgi:hypothetical protein